MSTSKNSKSVSPDFIMLHPNSGMNSLLDQDAQRQLAESMQVGAELEPPPWMVQLLQQSYQEMVDVSYLHSVALERAHDIFELRCQPMGRSELSQAILEKNLRTAQQVSGGALNALYTSTLRLIIEDILRKIQNHQEEPKLLKTMRRFLSGDSK